MAKCRPGSILEIALPGSPFGEAATLGHLERSGGKLYALTAGHACKSSPGLPVYFFDGGLRLPLGRVESFLFDAKSDVGLISVEDEASADETPPPFKAIKRLGFPLSRGQIRHFDGKHCLIHLGYRDWTPGTIRSPTQDGRFQVEIGFYGIDGESGSPCFVESGGWWKFAGIFTENIASHAPRLKFHHAELSAFGDLS